MHKIKRRQRTENLSKASRILLLRFKTRLVRKKEGQKYNRLKISEILENGVVGQLIDIVKKQSGVDTYVVHY